MKTKLFGGSDDLIEIDGAISDEHGCYSDAKRGVKFQVSDGTNGIIKYEGEWRIEVLDPGKLISEHIKSVGDDLEHGGNAKGCTSYSDVLIFDEGVEWVKIGRTKYKK